MVFQYSCGLSCCLNNKNHLRRSFGRLVGSAVFYGAIHRRCFFTHKKRRCKTFTAPFTTKPLTSNRKQAACFIVTLLSTGMSQKVVTFSTASRPRPYPLRTGGRPDTYTPASAALPSQPLYQAAFERVRGLHSLTT